MFDKIKISKKEYEFLKTKSKMLDDLLESEELRHEKFRKYNHGFNLLRKAQDELCNKLDNGVIPLDVFESEKDKLNKMLSKLTDEFLGTTKVMKGDS